ECALLLTPFALIHDLDCDAACEVGHLTEALCERVELEVVGLHHREVRLEDRGRAGPSAYRGAHHLHWSQRFAEVIFLGVELAVALDLNTTVVRKRVDGRNTNAVQAT